MLKKEFLVSKVALEEKPLKVKFKQISGNYTDKTSSGVGHYINTSDSADGVINVGNSEVLSVEDGVCEYRQYVIGGPEVSVGVANLTCKERYFPRLSGYDNGYFDFRKLGLVQWNLEDGTSAIRFSMGLPFFFLLKDSNYYFHSGSCKNDSGLPGYRDSVSLNGSELYIDGSYCGVFEQTTYGIVPIYAVKNPQANIQASVEQIFEVVLKNNVAKEIVPYVGSIPNKKVYLINENANKVENLGDRFVVHGAIPPNLYGTPIVNFFCYAGDEGGYKVYGCPQYVQNDETDEDGRYCLVHPWSDLSLTI